MKRCKKNNAVKKNVFLAIFVPSHHTDACHLPNNLCSKSDHMVVLLRWVDPDDFLPLNISAVFSPCRCAGADVNAVDLVQGKGLKDWALKTGRFETLNRLRRLQTRPIAEQFCDSYIPEWPELKLLVAKATAAKTAGQKLRQRLKDSLSFRFPHDPQDNGVMDHMVRMTTSIHSPLIATGCRPLCPTSPPEIGKRRFAVPELLDKHSSKELEESTVSHSNGSITSASPVSATSASVSLTSCCQNSERRQSSPTGGVKSFMPRSLAHRNSIFPSGCIPKIEVTKSGERTPKKEKKNKRQKGYLEPPVWKYKEAKEEKKKEKQQGKEKEEQKKSKGSKRSWSKNAHFLFRAADKGNTWVNLDPEHALAGFFTCHVFFSIFQLKNYANQIESGFPETVVYWFTGSCLKGWIVFWRMQLHWLHTPAMVLFFSIKGFYPSSFHEQLLSSVPLWYLTAI